MILEATERSDLLVRYKSRIQKGQHALRDQYRSSYEQDPDCLLYESSHLIDEVLRDLWTELHFPDLRGGWLWPRRAMAGVRH